MSYDDDVVAFLSQPENLGLALEIAERAPAVRLRVEHRFWERVHARIEELLVEKPAVGRDGGWTPGHAPWKNVSGGWFGAWLHPGGATLKGGVVYPRLEREGGRLFIGVCRTGVPEPSLGAARSAVDKLTASLRAKAFGGKPNEWWLGWKYTDGRTLASPSVLVEIAKDQRFADEQASLLWELFSEHVELLDEINRVVRAVATTESAAEVDA